MGIKYDEALEIIRMSHNLSVILHFLIADYKLGFTLMIPVNYSISSSVLVLIEYFELHFISEKQFRDK